MTLTRWWSALELANRVSDGIVRVAPGIEPL